MRTSVLLISTENTSEAVILTNGVAELIALEIPIAKAVLPVPGGPVIKIARPAIFPS